MHRRSFATGVLAVAAGARWLMQPAAAVVAAEGSRRVGAQDLAELWSAAEKARQWDARYGGASVRTCQVVDVLTTRATPLLAGKYSEEVGAGLRSATAELRRLAGWAAFDAGRHDVAQLHFDQALGLAQDAGDTELECYILATMALQTMRRGYPSQAIDMAQGAVERAGRDATPKVKAFARLIEARAHARTGDERSASRALSDCEQLLDDAQEREAPTYIDYFGPARMASDAVEVYRDLGKPHIAARWDAQCAMPAGHTRAVGLRLSVTATAHLQAGGVGPGPDRRTAHGGHPVRRRVRPSREYVEDIHTALTPWAREPRVQEWQVEARRRLSGDGAR